MNKIIAGLFLICLLAITSCSNSDASPSVNNNVSLGTLPTGSTVFIDLNPINIVNLESSTLTLSLSGGQSGLTYTFTFNESINAPIISPNSCTLVTGLNNSCQLTILPNFAGNGNYDIAVNYALNNTNTTNNSNQNMANTSVFDKESNYSSNSLPTPVSVVVSGTTQARITSPFNSQKVGVGTPIVIQFNNPVKPDTVNQNTFKLISNSLESVTAESIIVAADNESATFIVTSSYQNTLNVNTQYTVMMTNGIIDVFGNPIVETDFSFTTQTESYIIFLTESYFSGNLLGTANALNPQGNYTNGVDAADYLCQRDSNRPNNGNYKAMLVDDTGQYRSAYPVPINWVFVSYSSYVNTQESQMFITGINPANGNPFYVAVSPVTFNGYALNLISPIVQPSFFTGLATNWTTIPGRSCQSWTSDDASQSLYYGYSMINYAVPYLSSFNISVGVDQCNSYSSLNPYYLFCVEQP